MTAGRGLVSFAQLGGEGWRRTGVTLGLESLLRHRQSASVRRVGLGNSVVADESKAELLSAVVLFQLVELLVEGHVEGEGILTPGFGGDDRAEEESETADADGERSEDGRNRLLSFLRVRSAAVCVKRMGRKKSSERAKLSRRAREYAQGTRL